MARSTSTTNRARRTAGEPRKRPRGGRTAAVGLSCLNDRPVDPDNLRILIVSPPKTGNTWLRLLLRHAYGLRDVDLPVPFSTETAAGLGQRWISHTHLMPRPELVNWLVTSGVTVLTTVRHPGDALVSLFHYLRWAGDANDPASQMLRADGDRPADGTEQFAREIYGQTYSIARAWASLGSHVVRYEDLVADPLEQLRRLTGRIQTVAEPRLRRAVLLGDPRLMRALREVDPRHVRKAAPGSWREDLPDRIVAFLETSEPFRSACEQYGYDWSTAESGPEARRFDYGTLSPFGRKTTFDNGDPVSAILVRIHLDAGQKHPGRWRGDPAATDARSFWAWLMAPCEAARAAGGFPPATFTNLMREIWETRKDLADAFPDPLSRDRLRFALWFVERAQIEFGVSWRMVEPVLQAALEHIAATHDAAPVPQRRKGRILRIEVTGHAADSPVSVEAGTELRFEMVFKAATRLAAPVFGLVLRTQAERPVFATDSLLQGHAAAPLNPGGHRVAFRLTMTLPAGVYSASFWAADRDPSGRVDTVHELRGDREIVVTDQRGCVGTAWCPTSIIVDPD